MYIHRSFFAQAMIDDPVNPLRSQYAPSFLATYRSSAHILKCIREEFELLPELSSRSWSGWTFAFSAAVSALIFASYVVGVADCSVIGHRSSLGRSSLVDLDVAWLLLPYRNWIKHASSFLRRRCIASELPRPW